MGSKLCHATNIITQQKKYELQSTGLTIDMLSNIPKFKQKQAQQSDEASIKPQQIPQKQNQVIPVMNERSARFIPAKTPMDESLEHSAIVNQQWKDTKISQTASQIQQLSKIITRESEIHQEIFFVARNDQIFQMLNNKLPKVQQPLIIDPNIVNRLCQQRPDPFSIKNLLLPSPIQNLPLTWIYIGQWYNHLPHGIGKIYHHDFVYEGYVHRGIPHMVGRFITVEQIYEGEITFNSRHGFGRLVTQNGSFYQGEWRNDKREGGGFQIHRDGVVFEGVYKHNRIYKGTLYMPKGHIKKAVGQIDNEEYLKLCKENWKEKYTGEFVDNKFEGQGVYCWSDRRQYEGQWRYGKMNGYGTFTWPNGKVYKGDYFNNVKEGYGIFEGNGKIYDGHWYQGKPHGRGKLIKGNIEIHNDWYKGKMIQKKPKSDSISMLSSCEELIPQQSVAALSFIG